MESRSVSNITVVIKRGLTRTLLTSLTAAGIVDYTIGAARIIILHEKRKGLGMVSPFSLMEEQGDILSFMVDSSQEGPALDSIIEQGELNIPGRGSVFSEKATVFASPGLFSENHLSPNTHKMVRKRSQLTGICCVVQRGQANLVARVALDTGACVPAVSFGIGTGVRDKLGLLRIAIPAEKEIIHLAVSTFDADTVMRMMINAGNLDRPGKGFVFTYPISKGLVDTKITHGITRHVASIEQIIATLDELKGDTAWRKRSGQTIIMQNERYMLHDLSDLTLICNEGRGQDLVKEAMRAGAGGATISRIRYQGSSAYANKFISAAREVCNMAVDKSKVDSILNALEDSGAFDEKTCGRILVRSIPKAFTYSAR
jgi:nitrogen regulatory protein PII